MRKRIFVVIVNFNSELHTIQCIRSVRKSSIRSINIVVSDNASSNLSVEKLREKFKSVHVLENKENLGFSGGNNVGIKYALKRNAEYVFLLNPDALIESNTIEGLLKVAENDDKAGIIGPKIYSKDHKIWSCGGVLDQKRYTAGLIGFGGKDCDSYNKRREVDFISGTAMFIRSKVFEKIGLLTESYFLYYEDVDFCIRAKRAGFKINFVPWVTSYHNWSSIVGKESPLKKYYMARNHLLFVEKNAPIRARIRELLRLSKTLYDHYKMGESCALLGIKDYFLRRFGKRDYWG